ncbi:senescence-specific cysteine protease SAG39-like [Dioscorea cayenensis subsp. rotundata]|uniref:Senescence-specific cysteine protease SAG39-like n=1 Tax=Dioscorea cayennensis subsp. rotundata TaxID=55577 RepID=A0AB40CBP6_DIOCR|nr:senescence-specific cysteine protease SAG39-like [Dioscorea cayenensis subsp. rotundata]
MAFMASNKCSLLALLVLSVFVLVTASRVLNEVSMSDRHNQWMLEHGRAYKDVIEKQHHFEIYKKNVEFIDSFNAGDHKFKLVANHFADLTNEEFRAMYNGFRLSSTDSSKAKSSFKYENITAVAEFVDWRTKGAVTHVKNQQQCSCCWAFSAVAAMEGAIKLSTGNLISLSEQEVVDCDVYGEDHGCNPSFTDGAYKFIIQNGGLTTETNYPYMATQGTCNRQKAASHAAQINGYEEVPANNEAALLMAVANQPVSVTIDASGSAFRFYSNGVFNGPCGTELDHAVTAVGYGQDSDGTKYWLIKNSWGESWGEEGYIRMERDVEYAQGLCGIAMQASYPTI